MSFTTFVIIIAIISMILNFFQFSKILNLLVTIDNITTEKDSVKLKIQKYFSEYNLLRKEVDYLKTRIDSKDVIIETLKKTIITNSPKSKETIELIISETDRSLSNPDKHDQLQ